MNVRTDRQIDRQTDRPHELHVYVGLAQARPNYVECLYRILQIVRGGKVSRMDKVLLIRWKTFADCSLQ